MPGNSGIDTRELIKLLREKGSLKGAIAPLDLAAETIVNRLKNKHSQNEEVQKIYIKKPYIIPETGNQLQDIHLGMKQNDVKELKTRYCHIIVVPYNCALEQIKRFNPEGVIVSNGPGNPLVLEETMTLIKQLSGQLPILGIGLGHQLLALVNGLEVEKTKNGNYNSSYPVKNLETNISYLTNENTHYHVKRESIEGSDLKIIFEGLNDQSV